MRRTTIFSHFVPRFAIRLFCKPGLDLFLVWNSADAFYLAVNDHSRRSKDAGFGNLNDIGHLFNIGIHYRP